MSVLVGRLHELSTAPATRRHFARALDGELRHVPEYSHAMANGRDVRVFVSEVSREVVAAIERADGEITGVSEAKYTLAVRVREDSR